MNEGGWKERVLLAMIPFTVYWLARLWFLTIRIHVLSREVYENYFLGPSTQGNIVAASWHRHAAIFVYFFRKLDNGGIMISRSRDGEYIARIAARFGFTPIRGSSSRGGGEALDAMAQYLSTDTGRRFCGTAVDGPRGPARKLKKGMLILAQETDSYFIPMAASGTRVLTLSSWDKTIFPLPFSTVVLDFGLPFKVPRDISEGRLETLRVSAEEALDRLTDGVDRVTGYTPPTASDRHAER
jgi:lysophospholipid acyltransferase (LPLAT)-like uncharacterized protein